MSEIPRIPAIPDELRIAAREGRVIPFVGAGASRLANCPGWDEFANQLLSQLVVKNALNYSQVEQISRKNLNPRVKISLARNIALDRGIALDYEAAIHPKGDTSNAEGRRLYRALTQLANVFVTTNYDYWLDIVLDTPPASPTSPADQVTSLENNRRHSVFRIDDFSVGHLHTPNTVIHLHGSLTDPTSMIMTTGDYLGHYRQEARSGGVGENKVSLFLRHLFAERIVLFIGYGLDDLEVLEYVALKHGQSRGGSEAQSRHYMLQAFYSHESQIADYLTSYFKRELGVTLLPYLLDQNKYRQLIDVVEHYAKEIPASATLRIQQRAEMEALLND